MATFLGVGDKNASEIKINTYTYMRAYAIAKIDCFSTQRSRLFVYIQCCQSRGKHLKIYRAEITRSISIMLGLNTIKF